MPSQARVIWDPGFTRYDFGPHHPMSPVRLDLTAKMCEAFGLFAHPDVEVVKPPVADDSVLQTVHDPVYIAAVKEASAEPGLADPRFGIGTDDDPAFLGMHEASARIVEGTRDLCEAVWTGATEHGVNFCGGLHHAMPNNASGFCIYNDVAVGIRWLLAHGVERVAYVDVDVHHGDGVEAIFWDDPRVLTVSIHETGRALFPGTGWATDIGGSHAHGQAVNISLPPGVGDADWLRAFHSVALPVVRSFQPEVLVSQHGADTHAQDPLAHLALSVDAQRDAAVVLHRLSHELCDGKWIALGGGGYEIVNVVPADVDPPDRDRLAPPDPAAGRGARSLDRVRHGAEGAPRAEPDGGPAGRRAHLVAVLGPWVRPRQPGGPSHHGDPARRLPAARSGRVVRLTRFRGRSFRATAACRLDSRCRPGLTGFPGVTSAPRVCCARCGALHHGAKPARRAQGGRR